MLNFGGIHDLKVINLIVYALTFVGNYQWPITLAPSDLVVDIFVIKWPHILPTIYIFMCMSLHVCMYTYMHFCVCVKVICKLCVSMLYFAEKLENLEIATLDSLMPLGF